MFDQLAAGEGFDGPVAMCGVLSAKRMYARYDLRNLSLLVQGFLKWDRGVQCFYQYSVLIMVIGISNIELRSAMVLFNLRSKSIPTN